MQALTNILRSLMSKMKLSESELSRQTDIGQPVIHRMLSGETHNPKVQTLRPVAKFFGVSISQLMGDEPLNMAHDPNKSGRRHLVTIPLISPSQAIFWPTSNPHNDPYVFSDINVSPQAFAMELQDSTMLPRFPEGTLLIVDPQHSAQNGDYVVAHLATQKVVTFKQFLVDGENRYLKPLNPDFNITKIDNHTKIIGTMLQARMNFIPSAKITSQKTTYE